MVAFAIAAIAEKVTAFESGVYAKSEYSKFVFTSRHSGAIFRGADMSDVGLWKIESVDGKTCVVFTTWRNGKLWVSSEPDVWVFEDSLRGLRTCGQGKSSVTNAVAQFAGFRKRWGDMPLLSRIPDTLTPELEKRVDDEVAKFLRKRKEQLEKDRFYEFVEVLRTKPEMLVEFEPEYPELDPDEDVPAPDGMGALYPEKMQIIGQVLMDGRVKFKEETLLKFLDKLDWNRGDLFVFAMFRRPEITPESRRRLAPKVFARFGKSDDRIVSTFFSNPNTPIEVLAAARKMGGYGEYTAKAIAERMENESEK